MKVAPHVGAWIEMAISHYINRFFIVAPHVGAWIEIVQRQRGSDHLEVAPHVGAWIEINAIYGAGTLSLSHPTWVRGLK